MAKSLTLDVPEVIQAWSHLKSIYELKISVDRHDEWENPTASLHDLALLAVEFLPADSRISRFMAVAQRIGRAHNMREQETLSTEDLDLLFSPQKVFSEAAEAIAASNITVDDLLAVRHTAAASAFMNKEEIATGLRDASTFLFASQYRLQELLTEAGQRKGVEMPAEGRTK
ncbi:MAG: hypothetical protein IT567_00550 [Alphaproteobacteria bacterium]|nr:hypothetical protein [Alphaproteobacteria bacterium]